LERIGVQQPGEGIAYRGPLLDLPVKRVHPEQDDAIERRRGPVVGEWEGPFIFPTGALNTEESVRYVGVTPAVREVPTNLNVSAAPRSISDLTMSSHRLVMRGARIHLRPTHWMTHYSPEDSGNLVGLDRYGNVINTERIDPDYMDEWDDSAYIANRSVFTFPEEMDLGKSSHRLMRAWSIPDGVFNKEEPMVKLANHIYAALHINTYEENAQFYVKFKRHLNLMEYISDARGADADSSMLVVKMSMRARVQETEIKYIAMMIARRFTKYTLKYGEEQADLMSVMVTEVGIIQYLTAGLYNPFIRAGPGVGRIMDLMGDASDIGARDQFARLKKSLGTTFMLTSPGTYKHCVIASTVMVLKNLRFETMDKPEKVKFQAKVANIYIKLHMGKGPHTLKDYIDALNGYKLNRIAGGEYIVRYTTIGGKDIGVVSSKGLSRRVRSKRVVIYGGHAMAVIPRPRGLIDDEDVPKPMETVRIREPDVPPRIGTWDMETTSDGVTPYMVGFTLDGETCTQFHGLDCVDDFLRELENHLTVIYPPGGGGYRRVYLYAHNGGRFDLPLIMDTLRAEGREPQVSGGVKLSPKERGPRAFKLIGGRGFMERNNRLFKTTIRFPDIKVNVEFRDSVPHINSTLDQACKLYGVENPKLGGVDHSIITTKNFEQQIVEQHLKEYLDNDVLGLHQAITKYGERMWESVGFNPITMGLMTASAVPKRLFLAEYLDEDPLKRPWQLSNDQDEYVRKAYHGGRCDVFYRGEWEGPLSYVDFVSMYPSVMVKEDMPMGPPTWHENVESLEGFWGFVRINVRGGNERMNGIRIKTHNGGLVAPFIDDWTEVTIFSEELRGILEMNDFFHYEVQYLDGISFNHGPYMRAITQRFFDAKQRAKGDPVLYKLEKTNVNSIYGHMAFKMWNTSLRLLTKRRERDTLIESGHMIELEGRLALVRERQDSKIRAVQVAAAVTAFSHLKLLKYMVGIERAGFKVLYCDTDSVVTNMIDIDSYEPTGKALGQMEVELAGITSGVFLAPKIYALRADHDHVKIKGISKGPYLSREETEGSIHFRGKNSPGASIKVGYDDLRAMLTKPLLATVNRFHTGKRRVMRAGPGVVIRQQTNRLSGRLLKGNAGEDGWVRSLVGHGAIYR